MGTHRPHTPRRKATRWRGWFDVEWVLGGKVHRDGPAFNQLYDLGEQRVLEGFFRGGTIPTVFRIGLLKTSYVLAETDTMTDVATDELTNAADGGYSARQTVENDAVGWPTSALDGGNWQLISKQVLWTATGAWADTAGFIFLMADGLDTPEDTTGDIIAVAPLAPTRQLRAPNDVLRVRYFLKLA